MILEYPIQMMQPAIPDHHDDWTDDDDEHKPATLQVNTPPDRNIVQVQLPAPDETTTPIPLFPPLQTLAPPGAPVENAVDQMLEEDVAGLDRLTAKQGTVPEAQFKAPRPPPIPEGTDDDDWNVCVCIYVYIYHMQSAVPSAVSHTCVCVCVYVYV